jgi:hypothetical protein
MVKALDLRDPAQYQVSIEWVRKNVVLENKIPEKVLQLDVSLPEGSVTLYMDPSDHYIMGFKGAEQIFVLKDVKSQAFKIALKSQFNGSEVTILDGLGADHGFGGLKTFSGKNGKMEGRVFRRRDLNSAAALSSYSDKSRNMGYEQLRAHLSLLVCMIAESARIPMMEYDFTNMLYYGYSVWADNAIRSFANAKFLMDIAEKAFGQYPRALGVEKLQKRAAEMDEVLEKIAALVDFSNRITLVSNLLDPKKSVPPAAAEWAKRFRSMSDELKITDAKTVTQLINTCGSEGAVRAAKQGVATPNIGLATPLM